MAADLGASDCCPEVPGAPGATAADLLSLLVRPTAGAAAAVGADAVSGAAAAEAVGATAGAAQLDVRSSDAIMVRDTKDGMTARVAVAMAVA